MPKGADGEHKKKRKKGPASKGQTLRKDLRAEKKKLKLALRLIDRDLRSLGIGKKKRKSA